MSKHRLVAMGDSLTQGFVNGAIHFTTCSYPVIIAKEMGLGDQEFRYLQFHRKGWLPLNPWEHGSSPQRAPSCGVYHNLAVWGFEAQDAYDLTAGYCKTVLERATDHPGKQLFQWFMWQMALRVLNPTQASFLTHTAQTSAAKQTAGSVPERSTNSPSKKLLGWVMYRMALRVLNPGQIPHLDHQTQISAAKQLAADGGIENLIIWLGCNNALKTVTQLRLQETDEKALTLPADHRDYTLWKPVHFKKAYGRLADEVEAIGAERIFVANIPHITIPPITHGTGGRLPSDRRYFRYYTRPWIGEDFDPSEHSHLTGEQAQHIDRTVDAYNRAIESHVTRRKNWYLVDICSVVERLAYRRYQEEPGAGPPPGEPYKLAEELKVLSPRVDSRLLLMKNGKRIQGGLFSLDGVHPTSVGYGIVAQEFIDVMQRAGVPFNTLGGKGRRGRVQVSFGPLLARDAMVPRSRNLKAWIQLFQLLVALRWA